MMTPVVIQLDDDNCDGLISDRDIPEIVFTTFESGIYSRSGSLHAISIVDGEVVEKWSTESNESFQTIHPTRAIAAGNFDGQPGNEIVTCTANDRVQAYNADGTELWLSDAIGCHTPSLADLDQDGHVEVIADRGVLRGSDGQLLFETNIGSRILAVDVTGDGTLDLVGNQGIANNSGDTIVQFSYAMGDPPQGNIAIGDLDNDGLPEIVLVDETTHLMHIWRYDSGADSGFVHIRENININGNFDPTRCPEINYGSYAGGGPPTIADTNGDGVPDVALAGGVGYVVFDGAKLMNDNYSNQETMMWSRETQDCSSGKTGSSVFDFDGDGRAEVVYGDEVKIRVYDGTSGDVLFETCNTNGTSMEYPVIADVDGDGRADMVVVSNNYEEDIDCDGQRTTGVRIFGDTRGDWVRTRPIWNQHSYHVTNVLDNGDIPRIEEQNYSQPGLNNFRLNIQPQGEFSASDLRVEVLSGCQLNEPLIRVRNFGEAAAPLGVAISIYKKNSENDSLEFLEEIKTTRPLYSAESEDLKFSHDLADGAFIQAIVDENLSFPWQECRSDNNRSEPVQLGCLVD